MSVPDKSIDPRLLKSARREFKKHGFLNAELKTICQKAGVTTGAVYKRYKGKEDLFAATVSDAVEFLNSFVCMRSGIDFSAMTDEEIYASWIMEEEAMLDIFREVWKIRDSFVLLISKAAGTRYENFQHDFVRSMGYGYEQYYEEAKKRGLTEAEISRDELHVLCTSFWSALYEPFIHGMSWAEIETHCKILCRFFAWDEAIGLKKPSKLK